MHVLDVDSVNNQTQLELSVLPLQLFQAALTVLNILTPRLTNARTAHQVKLLTALIMDVN